MSLAIGKKKKWGFPIVDSIELMSHAMTREFSYHHFFKDGSFVASSITSLVKCPNFLYSINRQFHRLCPFKIVLLIELVNHELQVEILGEKVTFRCWSNKLDALGWIWRSSKVSSCASHCRFCHEKKKIGLR